MSKKLQLFCTALFSAIVLNSQTNQQIPCSTMAPPQQWEDWMSEQVAKYKQNMMQGKTQQVQRVIPVVVHVIHFGQTLGTSPNISTLQVQSQIDALNADFGGTGLNASNTPSAFAGDVAGNTGISFCQATVNPTGVPLPEPGIWRTNMQAAGFGDPLTAPDILSYITNTVFAVDGPWDPTKYFNIYVSEKTATTTINGFATYPPSSGLTGMFGGTIGTSTNDFVWIWTRAFGTTGSAQAPYNKGRTATHEIGHWLGLRHLWGDGNCLPDYCNDTPIAKDANTGCPTFPYHIDRCGTGQSQNGEMFMNFMDMTDDACKYMFTNDQNTRMQTALSQSPQRNLLGTHGLCSGAPTASAVAVANFTLLEKPCINKSFTPFNLSSGYPNPSFVWSSSPPAVFLPDPTVPNPAVTFNTAGNYTLTLVATNTINSNTYTMAINAVGNCLPTQICLDSVRTINRTTDSLVTFAAPSSTFVTACQGTSGRGYLTGTNCYNDKAFAQYYKPSTYSLTPVPQVHSVIVLLDDPGTEGSNNSPVSCKIYGGTVGSGPAAVMASKTVYLGSITSATNKTTSIKYLGDPNDFFLTPRIIPFKFDFDVPVILNNPSLGFFAGVDISNMYITDSLSIFCAKTNTTIANNDSSAWVLNNLNNWRPLKNYRGRNVQLAIIPQITCSSVIIGINENKASLNSNIAIVPNPNNGIFSLIFTLAKQQDVQVRIFNSIGQIISSEQIQNVGNNVFEINLSNKPEGIYFTEISNGSERVTKKIIIAR